MKALFLSVNLAAVFCLGILSWADPFDTRSAPSPERQQTDPLPDKVRIQVALLLDTSNSMDGLIDQAKSRLWNIVNTLSTLKFKGAPLDLEIALYEYGNSSLSEKDGYLRQVTGFTTDLDYLSELLFGLRTNGGYEFCGQVIQHSIHGLKWSQKAESMKLVYIAGNEPFDQGHVSYKEAISDALSKSVFVNTIYCGDQHAGIRELWKDGADYGKGKYFSINTSVKRQYIETPYDNQISDLNERLNATYHGYGRYGSKRKDVQKNQDMNAADMSMEVMAERAVSKSKSNYSNASWDVVDAYNQDKAFIEKLRTEELPEEFQGLSKSALEAKVKALKSERETIQRDISRLAKERDAYIRDKSEKKNIEDDLGDAITNSIISMAHKFQYTP